MVRSRQPSTILLLVLAMWLVSSPPCSAQSSAGELQNVVNSLTSDNAQERYSSRDLLMRTVSQTPSEKRPDVVGDLLKSFQQQPYRIQLGTAIALAKQPEPWTSTNFDQQIASLYKAYLNTKDDILKRSIDDALANAKGYYRDAITDYNQNRIDDIDAVTAKFKRTATELPKSRYASNATFYHAQYLTRAYLLSQSANRKLVEDAETILANMVQSTDKSRSDLWADAYFYLALDRMLLGDQAGATGTLAKMENAVSDSDRVYVYQFLYSPQSASVDHSFPAKQLARRTREYLKEYGVIKPDDQARFIDFVKKTN